MKIKDVINEDADAGSTVSAVVASGVPANMFAVPIRRSIPRTRAKKESKELSSKKDKNNVLETEE